jgi:HEAT repeat protein
VTLHISGVADRNTRQAIEDKFGTLVDPGGGSASSSNHTGDRLSVLLAPVRDPTAFAQKVDFGTVLGVNGRVVTIVARKVEGPPPNADPVTQALFELKSPNSHRRADAARRLAEMVPDNRRADVARALEPLLNDPEFFTRDAVNKALGVWGSKENVPALLLALNHEHTRGSAIEALGRLKDERAVEPLAQLLENFFARHPASEALRAMGPMAEKAVIKRLHHHDGGVRGEAIAILKVIGTRESLPALKAVVNEQDFFLTRPAEEAIRAIEARP